MTPFRWKSSIWASVWPGGSESTGIGAVCVPVIVGAIVGRLSENAAVVTLGAAVSSWTHPTGLRLLGRGAVRAASPSRWVSHVCVGCRLITGGCTALLAALPQWPHGWSQVGAAARAAGTGVVLRKTSPAIAAHTEDGRVKRAFSFPFPCMWLLPFLTC